MSRLKVFDQTTAVWRYVDVGVNPTVSASPPVSPVDGQMWWDTDDNSIFPTPMDFNADIDGGDPDSPGTGTYDGGVP